MPEHTVKQGDCISSIADKHGFFWETVWDHPKNAELQQKRKDPNVLYLGDIVFVPEKEEKQESGATEQRHRFRKMGVPAMLRLRVLDEGEPRAEEPYILDIDGQVFSGTTDADGRLEHPMPPNAKSAKLVVGEDEDEFLLDLGYMEPIDEVRGIQARLNNLGFDCGEVDGIWGPESKAALRDFQKKHSLQESGEPNEATKNEILNAHGS